MTCGRLHLVGIVDTLLALLQYSPAVAQDSEPHKLLAEAHRLAWLTNWYEALPIYAEVEQQATKAGNRRDPLYAKFGRLRGPMQTLPLPDISEQIAADLDTQVAKQIASCGVAVSRSIVAV